MVHYCFLWCISGKLTHSGLRTSYAYITPPNLGWIQIRTRITVFQAHFPHLTTTALKLLTLTLITMKFTASVGTALMVLFAHASTVAAAPASTSVRLEDVNSMLASVFSEVAGIATVIVGRLGFFWSCAIVLIECFSDRLEL